MSPVAFDTQEQAEAVVRTIVTSHGGLATKIDIERLEFKFDAKFDKLSWMVGIVIALAVANFAKQFF